MKRISIAVFLWWFALVGGDGSGRVVGPFVTQQKCEQTRSVWSGVWGVTTLCWSDAG